MKVHGYVKIISDILHEAIDYYGHEAQRDICIEEMAELTKALCKYKRYLNNEEHDQSELKDNVIEETADVFITILQVAYMFGVDKVFETILDKVDRLKIRMDEEKRAMNCTNMA